MDIYDPQTLGIMVFGGFMVISAVGIALVSTFSMKETSYEEALAKQRRELGKIQSTRAEKKKKDKTSEKKSRGKKKEEKPNGKIPEPEKSQEESEADSESSAAAPEPEPAVVPKAAEQPQPAPVEVAPAAPALDEPSPAPSPKDKKKKKVAKVEPASQPTAPIKPTSTPAPVSAPAPSKSAPTKATPAPEVVKPTQATVIKSSVCFFICIAATVDSTDAPLYLPYKSLVSTISSMDFSEGEAHRLIEILSEKAGIIQDTWHTATQKGDPVAMLKKQLEEREKQLATEQEDSSAAKNRLRELTKELSSEKSKVAAVETRLSSQLSKREQEMIALQARMQASYQDHLAQTQRLNAKILSLQDQLEKGPNAQLARLQQENTILRDALNQATSQAESKQNAELAKLRQECAKLTKELGEKAESLQADEQVKKSLEAKVSAAEKQLSVMQVGLTSEQALQKKLEEVSEELRTTQSKNSSLQTTLEQAQQDNGAVSGQFICRKRKNNNFSQLYSSFKHHTSLQTECEQYRTVLAETEGMLKHLQKSVEEEETVWKSKMAASEEQLKMVGISVNLNFIDVILFSQLVTLLNILLQERLEKEKKLSKDLGQAATKLQQLLKATQDQLSKERETVKTLQGHVDTNVRQYT
uniref:Ribosome receptor lysine/proline rich domain-containing protein n=1 Tax=Periophthalmus magnuspinnatus TaxID=409849 RepID=A0A3B4BBI0_9GOBI